MKRSKLVLLILFGIVLLGSRQCLAEEKIILMFPKFKESRTKTSEGTLHVHHFLSGENGKPDYEKEELWKFLQKFEHPRSEYEVDKIELWVEGKAESDGITKLFLSSQGNAGCKITLERK